MQAPAAPFPPFHRPVAAYPGVPRVQQHVAAPHVVQPEPLIQEPPSRGKSVSPTGFRHIHGNPGQGAATKGPGSTASRNVSWGHHQTLRQAIVGNMEIFIQMEKDLPTASRGTSRQGQQGQGQGLLSS
mmetsp:Transcript_45229/g.80898  ORF Transcript_45229/g.80898 Transcript_45229/m.80898 type:complete len:128 (-) Transcript_45229:59-442(-)